VDKIVVADDRSLPASRYATNTGSLILDVIGGS
jgi:hypothetical protein